MQCTGRAHVLTGRCGLANVDDTESLERKLSEIPTTIETETRALSEGREAQAALRTQRKERVREHERLLSEQGNLLAAQKVRRN